MITHATLRAICADAIVFPPAPGISITPGVMGGEPCIEGTRIMARNVAVVMSGLGLGPTRIAWPTLTEDQIRCAVLYHNDHASLFLAVHLRDVLAGDSQGDAEALATLRADLAVLLAERDGDPLVLELRQRLYAAEDEIARLRGERDTYRHIVERAGRVLPGGVCNECRDADCLRPTIEVSTCIGWQARRALAATARADADTGGAGREGQR